MCDMCSRKPTREGRIAEIEYELIRVEKLLASTAIYKARLSRELLSLGVHGEVPVV